MNKPKSSLHLLIVISFILLIIMTFSVIEYFVFSNWKATSQQMVLNIQNNTNANILGQIERLIHTPLDMNQSSYKLIKNNIVDISNENERDLFFASTLGSSAEEVYSFSYGNEKGEYYGARRNANNEIEIIRNNKTTNGKSRYYSINNDDFTLKNLVAETDPFDVRTRAWYKAAKERSGPTFSPIYKHFVLNDLAISATYPIYDKGVFKGVIGTHLTLSEINNYLSELTKDNQV